MCLTSFCALNSMPCRKTILVRRRPIVGPEVGATETRVIAADLLSVLN